MSDVTRILSQIEAGDPSAAEQLLPLVYDELRKLAAARLAQEKPGQTLQATALVHEAYLRLVGKEDRGQDWDNRGHFFAAAAEAMRRILVDAARRRQAEIHGGGQGRFDLEDADLFSRASPEWTLLPRISSKFAYSPVCHSKNRLPHLACLVPPLTGTGPMPGRGCGLNWPTDNSTDFQLFWNPVRQRPHFYALHSEPRPAS
jgi:RNA polymerase sigma factor (TIGR02999 family)